MKFFKDKKGFTLVELVVVIAILGILAGIAIPRFMDATASARGAKIVADLRTIDSAIMMYFAKNGDATAPTMDNLKGNYLASEPIPPQGTTAIINDASGTPHTWTVGSTTKYVIAKDLEAVAAVDGVGGAAAVNFDTYRATIGRKSVDDLLSTSATGGSLE